MMVSQIVLCLPTIAHFRLTVLAVALVKEDKFTALLDSEKRQLNTNKDPRHAINAIKYILKRGECFIRLHLPGFIVRIGEG